MFMEKITETAYAKINLGLDVLGKRADGYHEVSMVMQSISLADTVTLEKHSGLVVQTGRSDLPGDSSNLAYKAAVLMAERFNKTPDVKITLDKHIFMAAGLAGGSSDAAAVLRGLNRFWQLGLNAAQLEELAAEIGSDVPFCICGGTQLAEGRGEKLTVLNPAPECFVAVCKPDFPISTPALFARVDGVTITDRPDTDAMLAAIEHGDADTLCANVRNVFEQALDGEQRERIETIKCDLLAYGAKTSAMTGSGSVVFGLFSDKAACRRACEALQGECIKTFCAEFV